MAAIKSIEIIEKEGTPYQHLHTIGIRIKLNNGREYGNQIALKDREEDLEAVAGLLNQLCITEGRHLSFTERPRWLPYVGYAAVALLAVIVIWLLVRVSVAPAGELIKAIATMAGWVM